MRWAKLFPVFIMLAALVMTAAPLAEAQVIAQVPVIDDIFPAAAWRGTPVVIQGSDFGELQLPFFSYVTFNGVDAGEAIVWSDTYIVVIVPDEATSGPVVVSNLFGDSEPYDFTVYEQPAAIPCYFAEGTTRAGFEEWLTLYNPYDEEHTATVTYLVADGANRIRYYNIPAHARVNIYINSEIGSDRDVSLVVTATQRLYAERPMYFRYKDRWTGGHCTEPALDTSTTWFFAEGTTRAGFEEWLCLANPGAFDAEVQVTFMFSDGEAMTLPYEVPAWKRYTVDVNATVGPELDVAIRVDSDQPIVAERPMYFSYCGMWDDGHITIGAPAALDTWYFAEGTTRAGFDEWLCLANPDGEDAEVEITYHLASGAEIKQYVSIPSEKRRTIFVNSIVGPEQDVAIRVDSNHPIVAERPMYFDYRAKWNGGTLSIGAEAPSAAWFFAEGTTRAGFEEWLCLLNPGDLEADVSVTYVFQDATTLTQDLLLAPGQRFSVFVNEVVGPDRDVAVWVESAQGIVAERSLYFSYHEAWDGGHNALGTSP
ncbi:MAG: IPT/TIG domain-containing protein [Actinobacteria bacterium]|nr:IPT/TIG domain-containing protein [Actinomycetota bacterium]